jgi:calcineurin-like phosphoesterase family protein
MKKKTRIFFTSDLWIDRPNAIAEYNRPFEGTYNMNEKLIEKWNTTVGDFDMVFILGNFIYNPFIFRNTLETLRGIKILMPTTVDKYAIRTDRNLLDNLMMEDTKSAANILKDFNTNTDNILFDIACDNFGVASPEQSLNTVIAKSDLIQDFTVLKTQIFEMPSYGIVVSTVPLVEWEGKDDGVLNFHGGKTESNISEGRINVRCDYWDFCPVEMNSVKKIVKQLKGRKK